MKEGEVGLFFCFCFSCWFVFPFLLFVFRFTVTKIYLYNFDPLKTHFYIVKLGFTGVYIVFFLFLLKNIGCRYSLEPPRRGCSHEYPQSMFRAEIWKYQIFYQKIFSFLVVKFSIYLNRHVFVMRLSLFIFRHSNWGRLSNFNIKILFRHSYWDRISYFCFPFFRLSLFAFRFSTFEMRRNIEF